VTLSPRLVQFLEQFVEAGTPRRYGLVTDFDGTLAPIVNDPARARPLPASVRALGMLAETLGLVGVVSGRPVAFLREQMSAPGVELVGQYGVERWLYEAVVVDPRVEPYLDAVAAAAAEAEALWPALLVERKGSLAVTIHWRSAPGHRPLSGALEELAVRHGLTMLDARMVAELRPPVPLDKGTALEALLADAGSGGSLSHVAYLGDDRGDLAAFDAIERDLDYEQGEMAAMRIAVRSAEAPPELLDRADVVLDGVAGVAGFLTAWAAAASR
jgi:trehalose 6-phosphate phosphatase